jgi:ABC-type transport system involved in multi-copper enzyme maturation permease subunit
MIADGLTLVRMDLLKLRRRRGLIAIVLVIALVPLTVYFAVNAARHGADPSHVAPAGGVKPFEKSTDFLGGSLGFVIAAMLGVTAGAGDAELGVLRDLVATGRSRLVLFVSRCLAAVPVTVAVLGAGLALDTACSIMLAGSAHVPSFSDVVRRDLSVLAFGAVVTVVSAGLSTFVRSRGPMMVSLITFGVLISQLLLPATILGNVRAVLPLAEFERMAGTTTPALHVSGPIAIAALLAWAGAALASGSWWARRVEV